jgi:putative nucleotide binding protein
MEDFVYILDYLAVGLPGRERKPFKTGPLAYGIGDFEFKLLELEPKPNVVLQVGERVYVGKELEKRDKIAHVKRRISHDKLTSSAQRELPYILFQIVKNFEERFVKFYNEAAPITTRFHSLQLLPGLGKKTLESILEERRKLAFQSFEDITKRTMLKQPEKAIAKRIELELSNPSEKYYLFVQKPRKLEE